MKHKEAHYKINTSYAYFDTQHTLCYTVHALHERKQQILRAAFEIGLLRSSVCLCE